MNSFVRFFRRKKIIHSNERRFETRSGRVHDSFMECDRYTDFRFIHAKLSIANFMIFREQKRARGAISPPKLLAERSSCYFFQRRAVCVSRTGLFFTRDVRPSTRRWYHIIIKKSSKNHWLVYARLYAKTPPPPPADATRNLRRWQIVVVVIVVRVEWS